MRTLSLLLASLLLSVPLVAAGVGDPTDPRYRILKPECDETLVTCYISLCLDPNCVVRLWVDRREAQPRIGTCLSVSESPTTVTFGVGNPTTSDDCVLIFEVPPPDVYDLILP